MKNQDIKKGGTLVETTTSKPSKLSKDEAMREFARIMAKQMEGSRHGCGM
jgi:hypothetical protein